MSQKSRSLRSASSRVRSAIDKAGAIQQREQLREMLINKFISDYAKKSKRNQELIKQIVNDYFKSEKLDQVSEQSLKQLKVRIQEAISQGGYSQTQMSEAYSQKAKSQAQEDLEYQIDDQQDRQSEKRSVAASVKSKSYKDDDLVSMTSSQQQAPKSVYVVDEEDEWTALVKFDTELYKKEQDLEQQRQREFKRKMKAELDKQLEEKKRKKQEQDKEEQAYVKLNEFQMKTYDQREEQKRYEQMMKARQEKLQRDKQVHDEEKRKRLEKRKEQELDNILVRRIQEEIQLEQQENQMRKLKEKDRLISMMNENEQNQMKIQDDITKEKQLEVDMQEKYTALLKKMEDEREAEKKEREEKIKRIMGSYAQTVVKDQKDMIKEEDNKMMRAILMQNQLEQEEEERKKEQIRKNKLEMRNFLQNQMNEKKQIEVRQQEESTLNKKQAQVWEQDLNNYKQHENAKQSYIKDVNLRHQEILKAQMDEKSVKTKTRQMTRAELQQNKPLLRELAKTSDKIKVHKVNIGEDLTLQ